MPAMKRKPREPIAPSDLELSAFVAYRDTGDVTGLFALADYLEERGERKAFVKMLRRVGKAKCKATQFFYANAGSSHTPGKETECEGRLRGALALAKAERWFKSNEAGLHAELGELWFDWEEDTEYDPDDYDYPAENNAPGLAWNGVLRQWEESQYGPRWKVLESLGAVTFAGDGYPEGDPYSRVVQAELCLEAMPD